MSWNPKGRALQGRVTEFLVREGLDPKGPDYAVNARAAHRVCRSAATIVMRYQQAERHHLQTKELDTTERALAKLNKLLVKLQCHINTMPEETCWILDRDLRFLSDDYVPAPLDDDGQEQMTRLEQCLAEISAMESATVAWADEAALGKGCGGSPGAPVEAAVASAALVSFRLLKDEPVGKNPEGNKTDGAFVDLVAGLFEIFGLNGRPRYHALRAVDRMNALSD